MAGLSGSTINSEKNEPDASFLTDFRAADIEGRYTLIAEWEQKSEPEKLEFARILLEEFRRRPTVDKYNYYYLSQLFNAALCRFVWNQHPSTQNGIEPR